MPPLTAEQRALLALNMVSGIGARLTSALLQHFGSAQAAIQASAAELYAVPHIGDKTSRQFRDELDKIDVEAELQRLARHDVRLVFLGDDDYPKALATITTRPHLLYVRGTLLPEDGKAIALVGSRHCTSYGQRMAEKLAADLARAGWTIVSGLARGIDGCAHRGALQAGGRTLAVLAGGLSAIYPPEHDGLANEVAGSGALVTEYHMRMEPLPILFPMRNRIISGLSRAVVVVEANKKSGALITVEHAAEQGRDVFAVPGPVDSAASAGALELLRNGAKLIRHADDILEDLEGIPPPIIEERTPSAKSTEAGSTLFSKEASNEPPPGLDDDQRRIWDFLDGGARHQDEMVQTLGIPVAQLAGLLLMLEMKKIVRRLPGNRYERY